MDLKRPKWLTKTFYKERKQRMANRQKEQDKIALAKQLWQNHQLSTQEDYVRTLRTHAHGVLPGPKAPHFIFISKCCCTSLRLITVKLYHHGKLPQALEDQKNLAANQQHPEHALIDHYLPPYHCHDLYDKQSIAFVRNPYHRLVSCFRNQISKQDFKGAHQKTYIQHTVPTSALESFAEFVDFACAQPNALRDMHYASQWFFLTPGLGPIDFIGHCEQFSEHAHLLLSELKAPQSLLESVATKHNHTGAYDWQSYYDATLAQKVYQAWWPDFEAFNYDPDSWQQGFQAAAKAPIRHYDPQQDIQRFRKHFTCPHTETVG